MIIFLSVLCAVSVFGDETLIAKRDGPAIKIEWTKTESLEISIPVIVKEAPVEAPLDDQTAIPTLSFATTTSPGTGSNTEETVGNITNAAAPATDATDSTAWSEGSTVESDATTYSLTTIEEDDSTTEESLSEETESTTTITSITADENSATTAENISNIPELTTTTAAAAATTTTGTTTSTITHPPCNDTLGRDFIFLVDAATAKEQAKIEELIEAFLNAIKDGHPCDRIALVSYAHESKVLIELTVGLGNAAVIDALRRVNYTEQTNLVLALTVINHQVLNTEFDTTSPSSKPLFREKIPAYRGITLKEAGKERIVVIVATAEGSAGVDWDEEIDLNGQPVYKLMTGFNAALFRANSIDMYGAQILLVTIGQPRFPVFHFVAPEDETVKIESFENFSPLAAVSEFCCRFSVCKVKEETKMCAQVKAREIEKQILYPKCEETPARELDAIVLIDRAGMKHKNEILNLTESFINLIDPWKTANRLQIGSYAKETTSYSYLWASKDKDTKEAILDKISKTEYEQGSNLEKAISLGKRPRGFGNRDWQDRTRQRVMIIIASDVPSLETGGVQCSKDHFLGCAKYRIAHYKSMMTGPFGAKIFLVTIGDLPMEILQHVAPEKEIVKIESFEKFASQPVIEEFKRRFCM